MNAVLEAVMYAMLSTVNTYYYFFIYNIIQAALHETSQLYFV